MCIRTYLKFKKKKKNDIKKIDFRVQNHVKYSLTNCDSTMGEGIRYLMHTYKFDMHQWHGRPQEFSQGGGGASPKKAPLKTKKAPPQKKK